MDKYLKLAPLLVISVAVGACSPLSKEPQLASAEPLDPDGVTCRSVVKTGTRLGTKVCKTNRDWERASQDGREGLESIQRTSTHTPTVGGG